MYEVITVSDPARGNFGIRWVGGEVIEFYNSKPDARRRKNHLNALIEAKAAGRVTRRRRVKGG